MIASASEAPRPDTRREFAKFPSCQTQQFGDCQHAHCFLHQFLTAPIAAF
jgi:hypothetical protein